MSCPIGSLSLAENQVQIIGRQFCAGHITAATYFDSLRTSSTEKFREAFRSRFGEAEHTSVYSESAYNQVYLFAAALKRAGTLNPEQLTAAARGIELEAPQGTITIDPDNNHTWLNPRIGMLDEAGKLRRGLAVQRTGQA